MQPEPHVHRGPRRRGPARSAAVAIAVALVALLLPAWGASASAEPLSGVPIDMRLLVISADESETDYPAIRSFLDQVGMPYDVLVATRDTLTPEVLSDGTSRGKYQGIVLTTGNLTYLDPVAGWQSAFSPEEWATLRAYQSTFGVRSVTSYTFPEAAYGLEYAGYVDTLGSSLGATLTDAGRMVWPYVNEANPVQLTGAWVYLGRVLDPARTTPLLNVTVGGETYPVASVTSYDGYENLTVTVANNPNLVHSLLLSTGWINWVTKGHWLGNRTANMDIQIDDLFIADDVWDPATNTASGSYRNRPVDITALVNYQNARRADPLTPGFKMEWAFNGSGASSTDPLTQAVVANRSQFGFINHTFDHFNLDCGDCPDPTGVITTNPAQIRDQIRRNRELGISLGLPSDVDTLVQPDISGINTPPNPMAQQAAGDEGIRYWIGDTSRPGQNNPSFNVGFATPGDPRVYVVPRHANNLFVAASTPAQWVSVFNHFYAPGGILCAITTCFDRPLTYQEILDHEANYLVRYLIRGDFNPWMFHIPNVRAYDGTNSLLTDLLNVTLVKYRALVKAPIRTLSFKQAGQAMQGRGEYNAAGVTASVVACESITLRADGPATVPVNGVAYNAPNSQVESYGGRTISHVRLAAGQSVTIPLSGCPTDPPPPPSCPIAGTQVLTPSADTYVDQGSPRSNFGGRANLDVRSRLGSNARALVRFELPAVPEGCTLTAATLSMRSTSIRSGRTLQVQRVAAPWTEQGVTWNTQPAATGAAALQVTGAATLNWDVTTQIRESFGANHGLVVRDRTEGALTAQLNRFASRESTNRPQLVLTFS
jgi:hypothetical protein